MKSVDVEKSVLKCLGDHYGLEGALERLSGENLNYLLKLKSGDRFVVKIVDEHMPSEAVEMESEALKYAVSAGFPLKLPEIIENSYGKIETGINIHKNGLYRLRLIEYIEGNEIQMNSDISIKLLKNIGIFIARFNQVMKNFDHPAAYRNHRWNLARTDQHMDKVSLLNDVEKRSLLQWGFDQWMQVKNTMHELPWQYIHGDLNRENILVKEGRISGLVDFGDSCMNPRVCDLAIAVTYFMMDEENPLETATILIEGYEEACLLDRSERAVLLPLVCGRLATSLAISQARRQIDPDNPNWFSSEQPAWRLLQQVRKLVREGYSDSFGW